MTKLLAGFVTHLRSDALLLAVSLASRLWVPCETVFALVIQGMGGMGGTVAMVEVTSLSFSVDHFIWVLSNDEALQKYPKSM